MSLLEKIRGWLEVERGITTRLWFGIRDYFRIHAGNGDPNGVVNAPTGSFYGRHDVGQMWVNTSPNPGGSTWERCCPSPSSFVKSAFDEVQVDTQVASGVFVDLLTVNISTGAGFLLIDTSFSPALGPTPGGVFAANVYFRILLDGVAERGAAVGPFTAPGTISEPQAGAITLRRPVAPGPHTVKLQWRTTVGLTMFIRPVGAGVDKEHASLLVEEVLA